jgi:two-component system, cell cycle sensor histidine kinase and response regulator CckA
MPAGDLTGQVFCFFLLNKDHMSAQSADKKKTKNVSLKKQLEQIAAERDYYRSIAEDTGRRHLENIQELTRIIHTLKSTEEALRKSQEELEMKVSERTADLNELNAELMHEIDERKQAENMLKISRAKYQVLLENTSDWVWEVDETGKYTYVSPQINNLLGYDPQEILGKTPFDLMPKDERERITQIFYTIISEKRPFESLENKNIHKNGHTVILETSGVPFFDEKGVFRGYRGIDRDITKRKQAEEALQKSDALLKETQKITKVGGWELDVQTGKVTWTDEVYRIYGVDYSYDPSNVDQDIKFYAPDAVPIISNAFQKALQYGEPYDLELEFIRANGEHIWVRTSGKPVFIDKNVVRINGNFMDITERKAAEEALRISEEKYRLVVENANDAIFIAQDGMIKFPNPQATNLTGYTEKELIKVPFPSFLHADDREMVADRHLRRLRGEKVPTTYSFRVINKAGETLWVEASTVVITWEGRPASLNFLRDITVQKKLEDQLLQAQKMEAIGTLAGGIAHDFNNLLMGILGYTSLMLMKTEKTHPFYEKLKTIEGLVESGSDLTKQLLGFARGGKYEVKPLNINDLIIKTSDMFCRTKKEIAIHTKLQEDLNTIEADRGQIEQVLMNLYMNAWQAMPSGGSLYLETSNVLFDDQKSFTDDLKSGGYIKITVADTGVGMDADTRQRIFEPFFSTKGIGKGTGLGLASTYGIIKNHGGIIDVYSEKGHGTTFTIYLPASGTKTAEKKASEGSLVTGHETILIVDDEPINVDAIKELLEEFGYKILAAQSGKKAIELYKEHSKDINLVILDMVMPEMNGKETLIKLMEIDKNVRVLLSSGYSINGEAKTILELGCKGFIQKPFKVDELSQKIRDVLDSEDL